MLSIRWWISTNRMTFGAAETPHQPVAYGTVLHNGTAPIAQVFVGQPMKNLLQWAYKQGGFRAVVYVGEHFSAEYEFLTGAEYGLSDRR